NRAPRSSDASDRRQSNPRSSSAFWPSSLSCARTARTSTASIAILGLYPGPPELDKVRRSERHRVLAGEARRAVRAAAADSLHHALVRQVREGVARDVAADLVDRVRRGDELAAVRRVDAIEAGMRRRRRADPQVDLARTGAAQHLDDLARRRAADERIVDD